MPQLRTLLCIGLLAAFSVSLGSVPAAWGAEMESPSSDQSAGLGLDLQPYLEYSLGLSIVRNQNLSGGDPPNPDFSGRIEAAEGVSFGGALGVRIFRQFRAEVALGYQTNEVENQAVRSGETRAEGNLSLFTAMVNGYYDYDLAEHGVPLIPFVGVGIGFGQARLDAETRGGGLQVDDDNAVFAWNVMVGVTYPISETTHISLGYRYLATEDVRYKGRVPGSGVRWIDSEYDSHDLRLGLRFNF